MPKKHIFLRVFQKIALFACVFCTISAWAETTTCDIDFTPVTGNSIQNGTPTPENPVDVISVGDKTVNLFDGGERGSYHTATGEKITNIDKYRSKNKIPVVAGQTYSNNIIDKPSWVTFTAFNVYGYDDQERFIWSKTSSTNAWSIGGTFTMPENTAYITISTFGADVNTDERVTELNEKVVIVEGSVVPTSYVPYGYQIPVVGTSTNGSRTTTSVYLNAPLRKVGDYADVLDYKNGQIIRNVGVKVLDGTEGWNDQISGYHRVYIAIPTMLNASINAPVYCSHAPYVASLAQDLWHVTLLSGGLFGFWGDQPPITSLDAFKSWLADQYAAGTPVTVYYPLATPVVEQIENWSCIPPITDIKIATTKMVDDEFAAAEANLAATVQTIESVVSRTITQTGQIQVLQDTKQTRPDENCPANMKCLLVQDEDGTPHWYPIIEP